MHSKNHLLGHFHGLDWRPLQFVDLPSAISCDLCAVIPENIFRLPCYHFLCDGCYQGVLRTNLHCPLDKQSFRESEAVISPVKTTPLQRLEVRCCNSKHGCNFVGSLERMKSHFLKDCGFHALACKKCCVTVLRKDIITHYVEERCGAQNTLCPSADVCIDGSIIEIGREISASLSDVADKLRAIEDQLNSHTVGIDATKECVVNTAGVLRTLQEGQSVSAVTMADVITGMAGALSSIEDQRGNKDVRPDDVMNRVIAIGETLATLVGSQNDVAMNVGRSDERWKEFSEKFDAMSKRVQNVSSLTDDKLSTMRDMLKTLRASIGYGDNVGFFHVQDVDELKKKANEDGVAGTYSDVFTLCGYTVKFNVKFIKRGGIMYIAAYLHICRSPKDSLLKWPFLLPYKLILVHPTDEKKNIQHTVSVPTLLEKFPRCFNRPVECSNNGCGSPKLCTLEDALNDGFVHEKSITVGVTLVQSCG
ncbi:TNF receptor-associated factor 2-like [Ornithodoros turicata]|uniref:TNF receptor-associated factor 2-like n=1 Tax=Ornithodoros turicata TaxID=34597 RepID=UPI00313A1475